MSELENQPPQSPAVTLGKFEDPDWTAKGEKRASVPFSKLETLWINTGTLCNIECVNCYIDSSPTNDRLSYISASEAAQYLDEIELQKLGTREIAFTGGEPFMNPDMIAMLEDALNRGFETLVLTNAMKPLQRKKVKSALLDLCERFGNKLTLRISLDHYTRDLHDQERGEGSFDKALEGIDWLSQNGFTLNLAGRTIWNEEAAQERKGYGDLVKSHQWAIDSDDPRQLILFPEMDEKKDAPEITTKCWGLLDIRPESMMCASSRMVIKRRGAKTPQLVPCTLIAYEENFEMGTTLQEAAGANSGMFTDGAVKLCHPYCAKFCVLGGGSCSV